MMAHSQTLLARSRSSSTIEKVPLASYVGENVLFWNTSDGLGGIAVWGRPPRREIEQFVTLAESILDGGALAPRTIFADLQELEAVDTDSFELVRDHIQRVGPRLAELGVREAVLRPRGLVGAVVAGFYAASPWLSSHRVFETAADAEVWLERPDLREHLEQVKALRATQLRARSPLYTLRSLLEREPATTIEDAAQRLGMSTRSLQRHLRMTSSSYRGELRDARLRRARALLDEGTKVAAVAAEIGFASSQHFATWFKRHTGESPGQMSRPARRPLHGR
jgi:AraC-like DNA-binding protein